MYTFRYTYSIESIDLKPKNIREENKEMLKDSTLMKSLDSLIGIHIEVVVRDSKDSPNRSTLYAENIAVHKASEAAANVLGCTFGGVSQHGLYWDLDEDLIGSFVKCKLHSITQLIPTLQ